VCVRIKQYVAQTALQQGPHGKTPSVASVGWTLF
jgi:hypothetical protein